MCQNRKITFNHVCSRGIINQRVIPTYLRTKKPRRQPMELPVDTTEAENRSIIHCENSCRANCDCMNWASEQSDLCKMSQSSCRVRSSSTPDQRHTDNTRNFSSQRHDHSITQHNTMFKGQKNQSNRHRTIKHIGYTSKWTRARLQSKSHQIQNNKLHELHAFFAAYLK